MSYQVSEYVCMDGTLGQVSEIWKSKPVGYINPGSLLKNTCILMSHPAM